MQIKRRLNLPFIFIGKEHEKIEQLCGTADGNFWGASNCEQPGIELRSLSKMEPVSGQTLNH